jgi:hypothetical protein
MANKLSLFIVNANFTGTPQPPTGSTEGKIS